MEWFRALGSNGRREMVDQRQRELTEKLLEGEQLAWEDMPAGIYGVSIMDIGLIEGTVRHKHRVATVINGKQGVIVAINRSAQGHQISMDFIGNYASGVGYLMYDSKLGKWVRSNKVKSADHPIIMSSVTGVLHFATTETSLAPCRTQLDFQMNARGIQILGNPVVESVLNITRTAPGKPDDYKRKIDFVFGFSRS